MGAAALAFAAPQSAWAAGWDEASKTYTVEGQDGYPQGSERVRLPDGSTLDLSKADATNEGRTDSLNSQFILEGDVTIIGSENTEYTGYLFCTKFVSGDDASNKIELRNFRMKYDQSESLGDYFFTNNTEVVYDGSCQLPVMRAISKGSSVTMSPKDDAATMTVSRFHTAGNNAGPVSLAFKGGHVTVMGGIEADHITISDGCDFTGYLNTKGDNNVQGVIESPKIDISGSTVMASTTDTSWVPDDPSAIIGSQAGLGELASESYIKISDSTVTVNNTVGGDKRYVGIGCVEDITIERSTVTVNAPSSVDGSATEEPYITGIGGVFETITIDDSNVTAAGVHGAGIGWGENLPVYYVGTGRVGSIAIQNASTVKATSVYGAGIGYGWTGYRKNGNIFESAKKYLPEVDVTISGADGEGNSCSVEAYSLMGAGIGSGGIITSGGGSVPVGEPLEIGSAGIAGWGTGANQDGEAVEQSLQSLASAPASSSARSVGSLDQSQSSLPAGIVDGLLLIEGSLTVDDTANVHAESGVCAIAFEGEVSTGQTIVQNTLREASDGGDAVEIMLGGTDGSAAQIKLGDLRDGFRSIAQTVPSAPSEIKFYWGSGEASRAMVNWYDAAGTLYDDTFSVTPGSFNSFFAVPPFDLHGVLTVSGTQTTGQVLTADKAGLEPNGATYALQWYMNGAPIEDGDGDAITADEAGVYYAVATGTGEYAGTVVSNALAVNADGATKPATPVLSEVTATSITLEDPQVEGLQYSIDFGTRWQSALAFNDLDPAATYYVICKNSDGGISDPLVVTTSRNSVLETGRISYNYETEQIYYSLDIGVYTDKGCTDRILRGSVITDLLDKDGGTTAYACYVGDPETLYEIMLKRPDAPEVNVKARTSTSITIATQAGVAYNYAPKGEAVPDTNAFVGDGGDHTITGLLPGSTNTILTRTPASSTAFHSYEGAVDVTTKRDSPAAPTVGGAYVVSSSDSAKFAYTVEASGLPEGTTYEYKMDDGTWQESALFDGIEPESQHAFYARAAETDDAEVGDSGRVTVTFDLLQGAGTVSLDCWTYGDAAETPVLQSDTNGTDSDSVTLEYKLSSLDDSAYTTDVPVNAGSYTVRATFAETAVYSSATATGTFTIAPRPVTLTWSESTFVYDGTAKVPTVEVANLVEGDSLVISVEVKKGEASVAEPTEVGDYTAAATSINQGEGQSYLNYTLVDGANLTHAYAIVQSTTDLTARADKSAYTYGETIVVTGSVTPAGEVANTLALDEPQPGEVALYYGETQISDAAEVGEDGSFELSYDTTDRAVPVGEGIGLEVRYVGNDSMAGSQAKMTVTIAKAVLTPTSIAVTDAGRAYDGTTALPEAAAVGVGFTGALEGDAVGLVATDAAYVSAGAGTKTVNAKSFSPTTDAEGVDWTQWYEAAAPAEALTAEDADGISQAAPTLTDAADPQELPSGATVGDLEAPTLAGVGGEPLAGTLTWYADEGLTQELSEGDALGSGQRTLWWRFVPADPNYSAAEGSVTVSVAAPPAPSRPSFPVEVVAVGGGSASVSPSRPREGDTVTVSPEPGEGLVAGSVEVVDASGAPVEVAGNGDGTWSFTQPDSVVTVTVTFVCDGGALCPSAGLPDVDQSQWYHGAVDWALESGTMSGYATGLFGPDDPLTREQFAAVLANACGADVASADQPSLGAFPDAGDVSPWARRAVAWAVSGGLLEGEEAPGGGRALAPGRAVTRAEMAAMAMRAVRAGVLEIG